LVELALGELVLLEQVLVFSLLNYSFHSCSSICFCFLLSFFSWKFVRRFQYYETTLEKLGFLRIVLFFIWSS
jgi:hypothetical protein